MISLKTLVVAVILPLMVGSVIFLSLQELKAGPLDLWQNEAQEDIDRAARNMVIGLDSEGNKLEDSEVASEQFRDLVIYSQTSAINCQLLYWFHSQDDNGNKPTDYLSHDGYPGKLDGDRYMAKYTVPGRSSGSENSLFNYLNNSRYVPTCVGTSNAIHHDAMDKVDKAARRGDLVGVVIEGTIGSLVSGAEDLWNWANCNLEPDWASNRGNDMEGRYGKITFDVEKTVFPGRNGGDDNSKIWAVNFLEDLGSCDAADNEKIIGPGFLQGQEYMDYLPYPKGTSPDALHYDTDGSSPPFNEKKSAMMDAIIDAPAITNKDASQLDGSNYGDEGGPGYGDWPRREVHYVICETAEGHIQTNANRYDNAGESIWGHNNKGVGEYKGHETRTFTYIRVTANKTSCFEDYITPEDIDSFIDINGRSCETFEDATQSSPKTATNVFGSSSTTYECRLSAYSWRAGGGGNGAFIRKIYQIGWVEQ